MPQEMRAITGRFAFCACGHNPTEDANSLESEEKMPPSRGRARKGWQQSQPRGTFSFLLFPIPHLCTALKGWCHSNCVRRGMEKVLTESGTFSF